MSLWLRVLLCLRREMEIMPTQVSKMTEYGHGHNEPFFPNTVSTSKSGEVLPFPAGENLDSTNEYYFNLTLNDTPRFSRSGNCI